MSKRTKPGKKDKFANLKGNNVITKYTVQTSPGRIFSVKHRKEHRNNVSLANSSAGGSSAADTSEVIVISDDEDDQSTSSRVTRGQKSGLTPSLRHSKKTAASLHAKDRTGQNTNAGVTPQDKTSSPHNVTPQIKISESHPSGNPKTPISPQKRVKVPPKRTSSKSLTSEKTFHSRFRMSLVDQTTPKSQAHRTPVLRSNPNPIPSTPDMKPLGWSRWKGGPIAQSTPKSSSKFNTQTPSKQLPNSKSTPTTDPKKIMEKYTSMLRSQKSGTSMKPKSQRPKLFQSTPHKDNAGISFPRLVDFEETNGDNGRQDLHNIKDKNGNLIPRGFQYLRDLAGRRQLHEPPRIYSSDAFRPLPSRSEKAVSLEERAIRKWLESGAIFSGNKKRSMAEKSTSGPKASQGTSPDIGDIVVKDAFGLDMGTQKTDSHKEVGAMNAPPFTSSSVTINEGVSQGGKTRSSTNSNGSLSCQSKSPLDLAISEFANEIIAKPRKGIKVFTDVSNNAINLKNMPRGNGKDKKTTSTSSNSSQNSPTFVPRSQKHNSSSETSSHTGSRRLWSSQDNDRVSKVSKRNSDSENDPTCSDQNWIEQSEFLAKFDSQPENRINSPKNAKISDVVLLSPDAEPSQESVKYETYPSQGSSVGSPVLLPSLKRLGEARFQASLSQSSQSSDIASPILKSSLGGKRQREESTEDRINAKRKRSCLDLDKDDKKMNTILDSILDEAKKKSKEKRLASLGSPASRRTLFPSPLGHRSILMDGPDHPLNKMLKSGPNCQKLDNINVEESEEVIPKPTPENVRTRSQQNVDSSTSMKSEPQQGFLSHEGTAESSTSQNASLNERATEEKPNVAPPSVSDGSAVKSRPAQVSEPDSNVESTTPRKRKALLLSMQKTKNLLAASQGNSEVKKSITKDTASNSLLSQNKVKFQTVTTKVIATVRVSSTIASKHSTATMVTPSSVMSQSSSTALGSSTSVVISQSKNQNPTETKRPVFTVMSAGCTKTGMAAKVIASVSVATPKKLSENVKSAKAEPKASESQEVVDFKNNLPSHGAQLRISDLVDLTLTEEVEDVEPNARSLHKESKIVHAETKASESQDAGDFKNNLPSDCGQLQVNDLIDLTLTDDDDDLNVESSSKNSKVIHAETKQEKEEITNMSESVASKELQKISTTKQDENEVAVKPDVAEPHVAKEIIQEPPKLVRKQESIETNTRGEDSAGDDLGTLINPMDQENQDGGVIHHARDNKTPQTVSPRKDSTPGNTPKASKEDGNIKRAKSDEANTVPPKPAEEGDCHERPILLNKNQSTAETVTSGMLIPPAVSDAAVEPGDSVADGGKVIALTSDEGNKEPGCSEVLEAKACGPDMASVLPSNSATPSMLQDECRATVGPDKKASPQQAPLDDPKDLSQSPGKSLSNSEDVPSPVVSRDSPSSPNILSSMNFDFHSPSSQSFFVASQGTTDSNADAVAVANAADSDPMDWTSDSTKLNTDATTRLPDSDDIIPNSNDLDHETDEVNEPETQRPKLEDNDEDLAKNFAIQGSKLDENGTNVIQNLNLTDDVKMPEHSMFDISQFFDDDDDDDDVMRDRLSDTDLEMNDFLPEVLRDDAITALRQNQSDTEDDDKDSNVDEGLDELPDLTETPRSKRRRFREEDSGEKTTLAHREQMMSQLLERTFTPRPSSQESIMDSDWMKELDEIASADPNRPRNPRKRLRSTDNPLSLKSEPSFSAILADTAFSRSYKIHGASLKKLVREKKRDNEVDKMEKILLSDLKKGGFRRTLEQAEHGGPGANIECDEDTKRAINLMKKDWGTLPILSSNANMFTSKRIKYCIHKLDLRSYFDEKLLHSLTSRLRNIVLKFSASDILRQTGYLNFLLNQASTRLQTYKFLLEVLHCHQNSGRVQQIIQSNLRSRRFSQSPYRFNQFKYMLFTSGLSSSVFSDTRTYKSEDSSPEHSVCEKCLKRRCKTSVKNMVSISKVLSTTGHVHPELFRIPCEQVENAVFLLMLLQERDLRQTDIMEMITVFFRELKNWDGIKYLIARRLIELCSKLHVLQSIAMRLNFNGKRPHELSRILSFAVLKLHVFGLEPQASKMDNFDDLEALLEVVDHFNPENLELLLVPEQSEEQIGSQKRSYFHLSLLLPMLNICIGNKCEDNATFVVLDRIWSILRTMNKRIRDNGAIYRSQVKYELSLFTKNLRILVQKAPKTNKASIFKYLRSAPVKEEIVDTSMENMESSSDSDDVGVTYNEDDDDEVKGQRATRALTEIDDEFRIAEVIKSRIIGSAGKD